ncbi:tryptase gamma-like [Coccinella septempunctata]|uniref:tryptase gamma-like n=1 Tax=Coccinella septempunctata TaxID=41139 RepID=UPI001D05EA98|nr:tryptase gamma-like [Coccinella septempunctata]
MLLHIFVIGFCLNISVSGQGLLPNGDPFFCVPPGICPDSGGIDPRIMTPTGTNTPGLATCPVGRVPCYAQGSMSNCGLRLVRVPNAPDGEAPYGAYPWQAFMAGPSGNFIGSGSLLSPYHVLTATHKVLQYVANPSQLTVIMGVNDPARINATNPRSRAAQIFIFNATTYNNSTLKNDIAIVRLATPISLIGQTSVNTICLPAATSNATTYMRPQRCLVSGWGQTQPTLTAVPTRLKQVALTTTDIATCARGFAGIVNTAVYLDQTGGQLCAGGEAQKDACFQDGGAPLTCGAGTVSSRYVVAGIVIWGKSCGQPGVFGVYTNVPFYYRWIVQVITQRIT